MYPIFLNLTSLPIALVGNGERAVARLRQLRAAGAEALSVYADRPSPALVQEANGVLLRRLPKSRDVARYRVLMIVDLDADTAHALADHARDKGVLVNVEDDPTYCDFYFGGIVQRGDLSFAVSTNGKSQALAQVAREYLEMAFCQEGWEDWLEEIAAQRQSWKASGDDKATVASKTRHLIQEHEMEPLAEFLKKEEVA